MKFATIVFGPIVSMAQPNSRANNRVKFLSDNEKLPLIDRPSMIFLPTQILQLADFTSDFWFDPPIPLSIGQWNAGFSDEHTFV